MLNANALVVETDPNLTLRYRDKFTDYKLKRVETAKGIAIQGIDIEGNNTYGFSDQLAVLFDIFVTENNRYALSKEQEKLMERYFAEADSGIVSEDIVALDTFMGNYVEIINGVV